MKVLLNYLKLLIITLFGFFSVNCLGQNIEEDRKILVEFYNNTDGANWSKNTNWLDESIPLSKWYGVVVVENRVVELNLEDNNLVNEIPTSFKGLDKLAIFNCANNKLTKLPKLTELSNLTSFDCRNNKLQFDSFYDNQNIEGIKFNPQQNFGPPLAKIICVDSSLVMPISMTGSYNYEWYKDGVLISEPLLSGGNLIIDNTENTDRGSYHCEVTDAAIPNFELIRNSIRLSICDYDSLGGAYKTNQVIVQFNPSTSNLGRDSLRNKYSILGKQESLCGKLELWFLPDTIFLPGGFLIIIEEIVDRIGEDPPVQEVDINHLSTPEEISAVFKPIVPKKESSIPQNQNGNLSASVVAIIDTGIDFNHPTLVNDLWMNSDETLDNLDNDGNCVVDDILGVNFVNDRQAPYDDHSHGTHIAGIIQSNSDTPIKLMALKTHNSQGIGDLFSMASAIYYAQQKNANVINMSTGYYGMENQILKTAIEAVQEDDIIVVASAGNSGKFVDTIPHYPSGHDLDNIISVAAIASIGHNYLASYSNFGPYSVDLATEGSNIISTVPGGGTAQKTGTSMSAAKISGLIAQAINLEPEYCYQEIISCAFKSVNANDNFANKLRTSGVLNSIGLMDCCNTPDSLNEKIISGNVARLFWKDTNCSSNYQVIYRELNTVNIVIKYVSRNRLFLNNLAPNTNYEYIVRSICDSGNSEWSAISQFQTGGQVCDRPDLDEIYFNSTEDTPFGNLNINWLPHGNNLMYKFQYKKANEDWIEILTDLPMVNIQIEYGNIYYGRIKSDCANGWTNWSDIFSFPNSALALKFGQDKLKDNYFDFYPNPAEEEIHIEINRSKKPDRMLLKNINGIVLKEQNIEDYKLDLDLKNLNSGVYFLTMIFENGKYITKKLIKTSP